MRVFQVIKHAALRELEGEHVEREVLAKVEAWSPPSSFLNAKLLDRTLQKSALDTAYARYCEWSARMKTKMKQRRQPLTTPCAPARKPARAPTRTTLPIRSSRRVSVYIRRFCFLTLSPAGEEPQSCMIFFVHQLDVFPSMLYLVFV